jgi:hypothetical protein
LNLLLQKGIVTQEEVAKARAEAEQLRTNELANAMPPPESKWKIGKAIKSVELFGDLRFRYEDRRADTPSNGHLELDRFRYSVRVGLRGEALDDVYYGLRLETASNPRSPWVTFGSSSSGVPYNGPFGKSTAGINVGQVYVGWHPAEWVDLTVGKMPNPLYTTTMVWDSDLNPEGLAERFKHSVGKLEVFATFGQFLYQDVNPTDVSAGLVQTLPEGQESFSSFLLAWQLGAKYEVTPAVTAQAAATLYNYTGVGQNNSQRIPPVPGQPPGIVTPGFSDTFVGEGSTVNAALTPQPYSGYSGYPNGPFSGFSANQTGINDLLVLEIPAEVSFKLGRLTTRVFGDYAYNLEGSNRARSAAAVTANPPPGFSYNQIPAETSQNKAYQIGVGIGSGGLTYGPMQGLVYGSTSRKHAWEIRTYWQHIEQYALDPNLLDSDFFEGRGNLEGIYAALAYGLTDNVIVAAHYGYAHRIDDKLGTGGSNQDIPQINPIQHYNIFQVDLSLRF